MGVGGIRHRGEARAEPDAFATGLDADMHVPSGLASSATRWGDGPQHRRRALADGLEH
jgi:hypothetical protein